MLIVNEVFFSIQGEGTRAGQPCVFVRVIADRADYEWSRDLVRDRKLFDRCPVLFSPVHGVLEPGELGRWILADGLRARLQIQLHKYLWPGVERGV